jgi:hypothetical protein
MGLVELSENRDTRSCVLNFCPHKILFGDTIQPVSSLPFLLFYDSGLQDFKNNNKRGWGRAGEDGENNNSFNGLPTRDGQDKFRLGKQKGHAISSSPNRVFLMLATGGPYMTLDLIHVHLFQYVRTSSRYQYFIYCPFLISRSVLTSSFLI